MRRQRADYGLIGNVQLATATLSDMSTKSYKLYPSGREVWEDFGNPSAASPGGTSTSDKFPISPKTFPEIIRPVQNRVIEIHDTAVDSITLEAGMAVLHFPKVYIHSSEGCPPIDAGSGWTQEAVIRIGNAYIDGKFSQESRDGGSHHLSDGSLRINDSVSDSLIPIPLDVEGDIELTLECWGDVVHVRGDSARLELIGRAKYVEEVHPDG